ncbi:MAG: DEAD/DEAH box helicase [Patescibacteria group bacterium]
MYNRSRNSRSGGGNFGRFQGSSRGSRGPSRFGRRPAAPLNPAVYVFKAQEAQAAVEEYIPTNQFSDFEIADQLKKNINAKGYTNPTPIQDQTIPLLLEGRDVVGIANTGTGKTAAFLLPLINKVLLNRDKNVLIVAPTRELAVQIEDEFRVFAGNTQIYSALCIGGVGLGNQIHRLRMNPNFVIGTPGRLMDLEKQGRLNLYNFDSIVLDEVDRMLDMGFIADVQKIIAKLPRNRQSLFFSATTNPKVDSIMRTFLNNPVSVTIKSAHSITNIDQDIVRVGNRDKVSVLEEMLRQQEFDKVLVFGRTKHSIEKLARELASRRIKVASIHGNKNQNQRQRALADFKEGYIQVLLATDVVSRGIDVNDVTHVINFDEPESYEDYIHRIGRTGRAGKTGKALTFLS